MTLATLQNHPTYLTFQQEGYGRNLIYKVFKLTNVDVKIKELRKEIGQFLDEQTDVTNRKIMERSFVEKLAKKVVSHDKGQKAVLEFFFQKIDNSQSPDCLSPRLVKLLTKLCDGSMLSNEEKLARSIQKLQNREYRLNYHLGQKAQACLNYANLESEVVSLIITEKKKNDLILEINLSTSYEQRIKKELLSFIQSIPCDQELGSHLYSESQLAKTEGFVLNMLPESFAKEFLLCLSEIDEMKQSIEQEKNRLDIQITKLDAVLKECVPTISLQPLIKKRLEPVPIKQSKTQKTKVEDKKSVSFFYRTVKWIVGTLTKIKRVFSRIFTLLHFHK